MRTPDDVIIAGAGPAGSTAALMLARAGVRVRLLDRATFPRHKLCGDTLNPGAVAVLRRLRAADPIERLAIPLHGMVITGPGDVTVVGTYPAGVRGWSVLRRDLDSALLAQAIDAGAVFEPSTQVRGAVVDDRRIVGVRVRTAMGSTHELRAPLTIAADGRRSTLAFGLRLARHPARPRRWAIGAYFDAGAGDTALGEMHVRCGHYIGVAPVPGGLTNVCLVVCEPRAGTLSRPDALLRHVVQHDPMLRDRFHSAAMVTVPVSMGPLAVDTHRAGVPGLLLAGDAAGFIDPITGDGLRFALRGSELVAAIALQALTGRVLDAAAALDRARRREFRRKWQLNRTVRSLVASSRGVRGASMLARWHPAAVRRIVTAAGDVPREPARSARHR
jgi:flavin-dependent dehydrogenase